MAIIYLLICFVIDHFIKLPRFILPPYSYIGIGFFACGILIIYWTWYILKKTHSQISPVEIPNALITYGLFKFSRNPMYLGTALVLIGIVIYFGKIILFLAPFAYFITTNIFTIPIEERNLESAFGNKYLQYKKHVRKWI